jgi:uncharacterized alpha-E superfamily protein
VKSEFDKKRWQKSDPRAFFLYIKTGCQLLYGILDATISRNEGWHFGKIGQLLERADQTSRVLDVKYHILLPSTQSIGSPLDLVQWIALLKSVSAYDMYRKQNGKLTHAGISAFLILDKKFPRSMLSCLIEAEKSLQQISGSNHQNGQSSQADKKLGLLKSQLYYTDIESIFAFGLHEYLDDFQKSLNEVSTAIFETFFSFDAAHSN